MVKYGEVCRQTDPAHFCTRALQQLLSQVAADDSQFGVIVADARRRTDLMYFENLCSESDILLIKVRVTANEATRVSRGWQYARLVYSLVQLAPSAAIEMRSGATHRSGAFKQHNKPHNSGTHATNRRIANTNKGRLTSESCSGRSGGKSVRRGGGVSKAVRRHAAQQSRLHKRHKAARARQTTGLGGDGLPPHLVAVISLLPEPEAGGRAAALVRRLATCDNQLDCTPPLQRQMVTCRSSRYKCSYSFVPLATADPLAVLDLLKVCDTLLLEWPAPGQSLAPCCGSLLQMAVAQGCPGTTLHLLPPGTSPGQAKGQLHALIKSFSLPFDGVRSVDSDGDVLKILRHIRDSKVQLPVLRSRRAVLLAENVQQCGQDDPQEKTCDVLVSGVVRGADIVPEQLVHIVGVGDYRLRAIDVWHPQSETWQRSFVRCEERAHPSDAQPQPHSTDAQLHWLSEPNSTEGSLAGDGDECMSEHSEPGSRHSDTPPQQQMESDGDESDAASMALDEAGDAGAELEGTDGGAEDMLEAERLRQHRDQLLFPDEVDTPTDTPARIRFQKYRGLASYRTSTWDKKENLPLEYAKIFQFENFRRTRKRVFAEADKQTGAKHGARVRLLVEGVPKTVLEVWLGRPLVLASLLRHECKMAVCNMLLTPRPDFDGTLKSKERVLVQCGLRRFETAPLLSSDDGGDKHRYLRLVPPRSRLAFVATCYAPVHFLPAPVLLWTRDATGELRLAASGSAPAQLSCTDRLVLKRVTLSGHPFRVHGRAAVVRYMFFSREDVQWFKPVGLRSKMGRRGAISQPLGTHGRMKCVFDAPLSQQDTVCMHLYKRVFPKGAYLPLL